MFLQNLETFPSLETVAKVIFEEKRGNCVPVYVKLPADLITPSMAYLRVARNSRYSFLLESVVGGENVSRYSFLGSGEHVDHRSRCYPLTLLLNQTHSR